MSNKEPEKQEDDVTFDMYHFFSRKDVAALVLLILVLLGYVLYQAFFTTQAV